MTIKSKIRITHLLSTKISILFAKNAKLIQFKWLKQAFKLN